VAAVAGVYQPEHGGAFALVANLKLPRLPTNQRLVERDGTATMAFTIWWQTFAKKIEDNINGINAALAAAAAAQATADAALAGSSLPTQTVALPVGVSSSILMAIDAGLTVNMEAYLNVFITSGSVAIDILGEYRIGTAGSWTAFGTSTPDSGSGSGLLASDWYGSVTNATGVAQIYYFRATGIKTLAGTYTLTTETSLLRGPV